MVLSDDVADALGIFEDDPLVASPGERVVSDAQRLEYFAGVEPGPPRAVSAAEREAARQAKRDAAEKAKIEAAERAQREAAEKAGQKVEGKSAAIGAGGY